MKRLYGYWRSSAAYRVRIALNLKGLDYEQVPVHLVRDGGQHNSAAYLARNPQGLVPALDVGSRTLGQSFAIVEYLEEVAPQPALLPEDAAGRARVRALALAVACEMHPLLNLRVLKFLTGELAVDEAGKQRWYRHWIATGFDAVERLLSQDERTGDFAHGDTPTIADVFLVPQVYNARRFECDLGLYPHIRRITSRCLSLPAFADAAPEVQPDAE